MNFFVVNISQYIKEYVGVCPLLYFITLQVPKMLERSNPGLKMSFPW